MSGTMHVDLANMPNLPGYGFKKPKKPSYGCTHKFQTLNGIRMEAEEGVTFEKPKFVKVPVPADGRRIGSMETTAQEAYKEGAGMTHTQTPAWDAFDRHVLRFYAYFKEAVIETNLENYRVRKVTILYYLEDDTCHVIEEKAENSGLPQGQLIRRHRFPSASGSYLSWNELVVGEEITIYGRTFAIFDCDPWTRDYCAQQGIDQGMPSVAEGDAFGESRSQMRDTFSAVAPRTAEKHYRENLIGGGHINDQMQQFMEWDRKVCRFYGVMDDVSTPIFERRPFIILYFLADDTVEIREQYPLNCGRDSFPIFFRRGKLPKGSVEVLGPMTQVKKKDENWLITDFAVNATVELLGSNFYIYDCDKFTREYFAEELHLELEEAQDVRLPERAVNRPPTPPYTGYGSWEDSMGSVHALMPKQPKKDFVKLFENDGKILRFTAQFADAKPEDMDRLFVVNFNMADDTMQIHEPPQRNIGIVTGRFLEKGVHTNQITGQLFKREDLFPGNIIKVYNRAFEILDADEYTRKFMESNGVPRHYDLQAVLEKLRESMRQQFPMVRDIFRKFDSDHDGVLTCKEFKSALEKLAFQVTMEEALVIMKHFDTRGDGQISYNEFCDGLLDEDYTTSMMPVRPNLDTAKDPNYAARAEFKLQERLETEKVRKAVRDIGDVIYKQTASFTKLLKEFVHMTHEPVVSCEQIWKALAQIGHTFHLADVERCVTFVLPGVDPARVNYIEFLKSCVTSFHDVSASR